MLQLFGFLCYAAISALRGLEFFGELAYAQAISSVLAVAFGYRQDIRTTAGSELSLSKAYFVTVALAILVLTAASVFFANTLSLLVFCATGIFLALFELNLAHLFRLNRLFICVLCRGVIPLLLCISSLIFQDWSSAIILLVSTLFAFALSALLLLQISSGIPDLKSFTASEVMRTLRADFYPLLTALMFTLTGSIPIWFAQARLSPEDLGVVGLIMKFVAGPVGIFSASLTQVLMRSRGAINSSSQILDILGVDRVAGIVIGALVLVAITATLAPVSYGLAVLWLALAIGVKSILGGCQGLVQLSGQSSRLLLILMAEAFAIYAGYIFLDISSFLWFSYFYLTLILILILGYILLARHIHYEPDR